MRDVRALLGWIVALGVVACSATSTRAAVDPATVPTFTWRARVTSVGGAEPGGRKFTYSFGRGVESLPSAGDQWSPWGTVDRALLEQLVGAKSYPNQTIKHFPAVFHLSVGGVVAPTVVEVEVRLDENAAVVPLQAELYGSSLGVLAWREPDGSPRVATMAQYNQRYWAVLAGVRPPETGWPRRFPIVDRLIGGDQDLRNWRGGVEALRRAGFSGIMLPPERALSPLADGGARRTAWAVYSPPGYAFDHDPKVTPEAVQKWAQELADRYRQAGFDPRAMSLLAMSDEPGWYYPSVFKTLAENPAALARFRAYLRDRGLTPSDVGATDWEQVLPLGRRAASVLPAKRLFYWTMRFFAWDSARHFGECSRALERAFYPGMPIFTNWNFFAGRLYVPGPVANNRDKLDPDAAMGGQDWFEYARMRGSTMLWTEDWFGDGDAYQWSFYAAKLRSAAELGGVGFGGYVVPRVAGQRADGILQKILAIIGSGGKAIEYFVFGPEYNFPGNCYSENAQVLPKMAEAHGMIATAEPVLWPGRRPKPQVAILAPRSAELWDAKEIASPTQIQDSTNVRLNTSTVDYMAEEFDLYLALQHADVPVDFVDEDALSPQGLRAYKVVYVTEPDVPEDGQRGLAEWVRGGGTVVTVAGAARRDRYDEPCDVLEQATGIREEPRERLLVSDVASLPPVGRGRSGGDTFDAVGVRSRVSETGVDVEGRFDDGSPAVVRRTVGSGQAFHFAWMPGLSYAASSHDVRDGLPVGWSEALRKLIVRPTTLAKVAPPVTVDRALVETPLLVSDRGAAVTILNWTGESIEKLRVTIAVPFEVRTVTSVKRGRLTCARTDAGVSCALPIAAADILMLKP